MAMFGEGWCKFADKCSADANQISHFAWIYLCLRPFWVSPAVRVFYAERKP